MSTTPDNPASIKPDVSQGKPPQKVPNQYPLTPLWEGGQPLMPWWRGKSFVDKDHTADIDSR
jgi:hypothetical protein